MFPQDFTFPNDIQSIEISTQPQTYSTYGNYDDFSKLVFIKITTAPSSTNGSFNASGTTGNIAIYREDGRAYYIYQQEITIQKSASNHIEGIYVSLGANAVYQYISNQEDLGTSYKLTLILGSNQANQNVSGVVHYKEVDRTTQRTFDAVSLYQIENNYHIQTGITIDGEIFTSGSNFNDVDIGDNEITINAFEYSIVGSTQPHIFTPSNTFYVEFNNTSPQEIKSVVVNYNQNTFNKGTNLYQVLNQINLIAKRDIGDIETSALDFINTYAYTTQSATNHGIILVENETETTYTYAQLNTKIFNTIGTELYQGQIEFGIKFWYYDSDIGIYRQKQFNVAINVDGVISITIYPDQLYIFDYNGSASTHLVRSQFHAQVKYAIGTIRTINDLPNNAITAVDLNGTHYVEGQNLSSSKYIVTATKDGVSGSCEWYIYQYNSLYITYTLSKSSFILGQTITENDIDVFKSFTISGIATPYSIKATNYTLSPSKLITLGQQTITITCENKTTTFSVSVVGSKADNVYIFDKTSLVRSLYGEVQTQFNMSFTCDGTEDSTQIIVYNYDSNIVEPNTIVYLESTDTWWIVKCDSAERYDNEVGGVWKHTLSLVEAFSILKHREQIVCGFNKDRYTIGQFFDRLISLTDFELPVEFALAPYISAETKVTYLKTFENYTPSSAIKEMFEGMNCIPKMLFQTTTTNNITTLSKATIYPIPKSGLNGTKMTLNDFDQSNEKKVLDSGNYGTRVLSNVQNCVSKEIVRYPSVGGLHFSSLGESVSFDSVDNAIIRLPQKVFSVERIHFLKPIEIKITYGTYNVALDYFSPNYTADDVYNLLANKIDRLPITDNEKASFKSFVNGKKDFLLERGNTLGIKTLENGAVYDSITNSWNDKALQVEGIATKEHGIHPYIGLNSKNYFDTCKYPWAMTYWEQGSDKIKNFQYFGKKVYFSNFLPQTYSYAPYEIVITDNYVTALVVEQFKNPNLYLGIVVDFIPMNDIKVKADNDSSKNDTSLYNQNGKLIDSKAISRLINSHAIEISSDSITRDKVYRNFFDIPKVGTKVDDYIINNVSIDFYENEDNGYYCDCSFSMTKATACKSTMISANTNIRDYDCPQQNNVVRKQTYRDYIEFDYEQKVGANESYMALNKNLQFNSSNKGNTDNHWAFIKVIDKDQNTWYYNLPTTKYNLNKQYIQVLDFKDNNIIGYEANKYRFLLSITKMVSGKDLSVINSPISYVDDYGELVSMEMAYLNNSSVIKAYSYIEKEDMIGKYVSLPSDAPTGQTDNIYNYVKNNTMYDMLINEQNYNKDGLEVPFFEYCCQVGDTNGIVFGEDFLKGEVAESGYTFDYYFTISEIADITQENANAFMKGVITKTTELPIIRDGNATLSINGNVITINLLYNNKNTKNRNICIYKAKKQNGTIVENEFLFAINNCRTSATTQLSLYINSWKLK